MYGYKILNTGKHTRLPDTPEGRHTAIDVTLTSASIQEEEMEWDVHYSSCDSDHLPQLITTRREYNPTQYQCPNLKFRVEKADPETFRAAFEEPPEGHLHFRDDGSDTINEVTTRITNHIIEAAKKGIPNNSKQANKPFKTKPPQSKLCSWYSTKCEEAKKERNYWQG